MTKRALLRIVHDWVPRLGLRGWAIDVQLVRGEALRATHGPGDYYADVQPDPQHQRATVRVLRQREMVARGMDPSLIEETLVHELLHLRLDPMSHLANDSTFEVGLDCLAAELVRMARVERKRRPKN